MGHLVSTRALITRSADWIALHLRGKMLTRKRSTIRYLNWQSHSAQLAETVSLIGEMWLSRIVQQTMAGALLCLQAPVGPPILWVPDHLAPSCMRCSTPFWMARRRHHCRFVPFHQTLFYSCYLKTESRNHDKLITRLGIAAKCFVRIAPIATCPFRTRTYSSPSECVTCATILWMEMLRTKGRL